jgi:hypothetical protein
VCAARPAATTAIRTAAGSMTRSAASAAVTSSTAWPFLTDGDQLARPRQQVVVEPPGERQEQVVHVRRVLRSGR